MTRVIAHRGASGYLPEHTLAAKALAYGLGADFLEQDLIATRDGELVVLHDLWLDDVSDVAAHYPGRQREDGRFYVIDFTLAELGTLTLSERRRPGGSKLRYPGELRYPGRFPYSLAGFGIVTFEDEIRLIAGLNATTGRQVGLYPEIKEPGWHARAGIDLTRLVHATLECLRPIHQGPVFVQSFDAACLRRLGDELESDRPRIQLLSDEDARALSEDPGRLAAIADYAAGVGVPYTALIEVRAAGELGAAPLARSLAAAGLLVHPYTLRRDAAAGDGIEYAAALRFLIRELGVDAIFCDHPDDAIAVRDCNPA